VKLISKFTIFGCEARGDANSAYLTRYNFPRIGPVRLAIHVFHRSDADDLHDHPWPFMSIILWRGYVEETPSGRKRKWPGMILIRRAEHRHRVELIGGKKAITLVFFGKRWREWGFWTPLGWKQFEQYFREKGC
jgi:hypothetical protein